MTEPNETTGIIERMLDQPKTSNAYVHGYQTRENDRLQDQAGALVELLHSDTSYPAGSIVLEVGCGVGAQTITLARRSPNARFISIDVSLDSIAEAKRRVHQAGPTNVAGFDEVRVSPRMVYVDSSRPDLVDGVTRKTFNAMIEGVRESAIAAGLIEPKRFGAGIQDLYRTTEPDGVFCYTFFKGIGEKGREV